jgi:NAD(P)-dependent dehydrogenase (short-subunit alcohol dehydrogenase family)
MPLHGKTILVTGASSGIGRATAKLLATAGARVLLASRNADALAELAKELPDSRIIPTDMANLGQVRAMIQEAIRMGGLDGLVNNAGRAYEASVEKTDLEALDYVFRLNVLGPLVAMQEAIPVLRARGGGALVNVSSGTAFMRLPGYAVYSSSKRALNGFSLTAREELLPENIRVSLVYPRLTATDFGRNKVRTGKESGAEGRPAADYRRGDPPEHVAGLILQALLEGEAEYFAHEDMRRPWST